MNFSKYIIIMFAVFLFPLSVCYGQETSQLPLWNVTPDGDTLRYVNKVRIPSGVSNELRLPAYISAEHIAHIKVDSVRLYPGGVLGEQQNFSKTLSVSQKEVDQIQSSHDNIWLPLTAMVISGGISAYYKLEANDTYSKYQRAVDENNITRYYDLTQKYDTYSAISFVILQGSFGWMIYKLLR